MNTWYVIYTHAQGEMKALQHLQRQGFAARNANTYERRDRVTRA